MPADRREELENREEDRDSCGEACGETGFAQGQPGSPGRHSAPVTQQNTTDLISTFLTRG